MPLASLKKVQKFIFEKQFAYPFHACDVAI
jgi:hypothetical protein